MMQRKIKLVITLNRVFQKPQNRQQWQYWHQKLYSMKTKKSSNKILTQLVLNLGP